MKSHHYSDLITLFDRTFFSTFNTRLVLGGDEPIYLPADENCPYHRIVFARGFYASALHEIAHWCVAGAERRLLADYGYWYCPDGRSAQQQAEFERCEVCPQAFEWILSQSAGFIFTVSCDNLHGTVEPDRLAFMQQVRQEVERILIQGLPERLALFAQVLSDFYQTPQLDLTQFEVK